MNNIDDKLKELTDALSLFTDEEKEELRLDGFQLDILRPISQYMKKNNISRKQLSKKIKLSENYLTDIFTCEKRLTLDLLYKFERSLNSKFKLSIKGIE